MTMTRRACNVEAQLKMATAELKESNEIRKQLLQEHEESEAEMLKILGQNQSLKRQLAELHSKYEDVLEQMERLQSSLQSVDHCHDTYEAVLQLNKDLTQELSECRLKIDNLEFKQKVQSDNNCSSLDLQTELLNSVPNSLIIDLSTPNCKGQLPVMKGSNKGGVMLQQILRDMWVDPEILAELDETQKQTLFCKMREEQVRRWQQWDQKVGPDEERPAFQKNGKKQVQFLKGEDGEPWVWVMGEHPEDKSIESMLAEEARQRALAQAREEAHQLRKSVEKELTQLIDYQPMDSLEQKFDLSPKSIDSMEENLEIYCTVEELRQRIDALEPEVKTLEKVDLDDSDKSDYCENMKLDINKNTLHFNFIEGKRDVLQEIGMPNTGDGVSVKVAAWERRVAAARATDILRTLRARRARTLRDAVLHATDHDEAWREQERKAKEAEAAMRQIARAAREAHRRSADIAPAHVDANTQSEKQPSTDEVLEWFRTHELPRGVGFHEDNKPYDWFHGLISRSEAEEVLSAQSAGSFLVRLSCRARGYAVSYRGTNRCKHYLVESAPDASYRLLGAEQHTHSSLADLINYHKTVPMTESGGELLLTPCAPLKPLILSAPPPS